MPAGSSAARIAVFTVVLVLAVGPVMTVAGAPANGLGVPHGDDAILTQPAIDGAPAQVANNTTPTPESTGSPVVITDVNVSPPTVAQGEVFVVAVSVANRGTEPESKTIEFEADYVEVDSFTVGLRPGAETTIRFRHRFHEAGNKTIELDHTVTRTVQVRRTNFPRFLITSISTPDSAIAGHPATVAVTVVNVGNGTGNKTIEFVTSAGLIDSRTVTLGPGQRETIEFSHRFPDAGSEVIDIDYRFTRTVTVDPALPEFSVTSARVVNDTVRPADPVRILVNVANTGVEAGHYPVELRVDGEVVEVKSVRVAVGERESVVFTQQFDRPGNYTATVGDIDLAIRVLQPQDGSVVTSTPGAEGSRIMSAVTGIGLPLEMLLVIPLSALIVILIVASSLGRF